MFDFYNELIDLKKENPSLWNGSWGGDLQFPETLNLDDVLLFIRQKDEDVTISLYNFSSDNIRISLPEN